MGYILSYHYTPINDFKYILETENEISPMANIFTYLSNSRFLASIRTLFSLFPCMLVTISERIFYRSLLVPFVKYRL